MGDSLPLQRLLIHHIDVIPAAGIDVEGASITYVLVVNHDDNLADVLVFAVVLLGFRGWVVLLCQKSVKYCMPLFHWLTCSKIGELEFPNSAVGHEQAFAHFICWTTLLHQRSIHQLAVDVDIVGEKVAIESIVGGRGHVDRKGLAALRFDVDCDVAVVHLFDRAIPTLFERFAVGVDTDLEVLDDGHGGSGW